MTLRQAQDEATPNPYRGESSLVVGGKPMLLRPSFAALVAAEEELGPLFALVERAGDGKLRLSELSGLFWHCLADQNAVPRGEVEKAVVELGLVGCAKSLRALLGQILQGAG